WISAPSRYGASSGNGAPDWSSTRPRAKRSRHCDSGIRGKRAHSASSTVRQGPGGSCRRLGGVVTPRSIAVGLPAVVVGRQMPGTFDMVIAHAEEPRSGTGRVDQELGLVV